jgi:DNA-binding transcriptional LysR family regulator
MELRHLRYFLAVAEELHFGRAAARLHMAQPPLSRQIRQLEEELGVTLLDRGKRRVALTAAGRTFLAEARRVLVQSERAVRAAQRTDRGELGPLALGFVPAADLELLPRALRLCRARFPRFELELHPMTRCQQVEALRDGRIQAGIVFLPFEGGGLTIEPLSREPLVAVLPAGHRLARHERVRMLDLQDDPMISFPRARRDGDHMTLSACRQAGFEPRMSYATDRIETNLGLVAAGLGVSLLPASIKNLRRAGVVHRPLVPPAPQVEMAVAYPRETASPTVTTFVQVLREATSARPRWPRSAGAAPLGSESAEPAPSYSA